MVTADLVVYYLRDVQPPAAPPRDWLLAGDEGGAWVIHWSDRLPAQPADWSAVAESPGYAAWLLRRAQDARAAEVDARTSGLQAAGFEFPPGSGQRFDLTPATQATWVSLMVGASAGLLEYPVNAGVIGDGTYQLQDASAVAVFCAAALARGRAIIEGAAAVKRLVYAAATVEAVAAVQDTRE